MNAGSSFDRNAGTLDEGEQFEGNVYFDPDPGCASPARVTVDVIASGRPFAFTLDVQITA